MKNYIEERAREVGDYILSTNSTVRQTARVFGVSKSTIHKDMTERLVELNPQLASQVQTILESNYAVRTIHGGMATKMKYLQMQES